jgi:hypothetical protein
MYQNFSEHSPAILHDFRMSFSQRGMSYTEPAYSNVVEEQGAEVHGVAFFMSKEAQAGLPDDIHIGP